MYPSKLEKLIEGFTVLPGVGRKTAERYALHLLESDKQMITDLAKALIDASEGIRTCVKCHNYSQEELCSICQDNTRNNNQIVIVSSPKEVVTIEKTNQYHGLYHVLGGYISTRRGILPEDLNIEDIKERISKDTELILGLNATVEGETTALYLSKKYGSIANITRLAFGLPIGGQLDYADDLTLMKAFEGRKKM